MPELPDTSLIAAQIVAERARLVIPSIPGWIEPTVEYLRQKAVLIGACQETRSRKLLIALHEAITNAMIHGNLEVSSDLKEQDNHAFAEVLAQRASDPNFANRKVDIVVDYDGDWCRWIITDQGKGFDVERVLARCLSDDPEILLASGRGILMMKSLLDDVCFSMGGRRVVLSLSRHSGEERRKDVRVPLHAPFRITPLNNNGDPDWSKTHEAMSRNFSEHGIALLQHQLDATSEILIGIPTEHGIVHIPAAVKHSRPLGDQSMELGCQFNVPLAASNPLPTPPPIHSPQVEAAQRLISTFLEACQAVVVPSHERREHPRVGFNERLIIHVEGRTAPLVGYARDLSKGGIALIVHQPISDEIAVTFPATATRQATKIHCRVVRCSQIQKGFYDVGAKFLAVDTRGVSTPR